ncbi:hypothetical protein [Bacteroides sp. MSB163]|uniref:hypothetical protein n=1 Tax=Bacteroides maternus TaxID=3117552 RepID=UPI002ED7F62B
MKLNEAAHVNTIGSEFITLMDANGSPLKINKADLAEAIRDNIPEANIINKGLMPAGLIGFKNVMTSVLLCETTALAITGSILLSVSATTSGIPNLYFISMGRAGGSTGNPTVRVKVLSGDYTIKIIGKILLCEGRK